MEKLPRCKKCGFIPAIFKEYHQHCFEYEVLGGIIQFEEGTVSEKDNITGVSAVCVCGHEWKLRKVKQITEFKI